jgi:hypothetical protein
MTRIRRMPRIRRAGPLMVCLAAALSSCGEPSMSTPASPVGVETSFAKTSSSCDVSSLLSLARGYFSTPQQQTTTDTLKAMQTECAAGDGVHVVAGGWSILSTIDTISAAGTGGSGAGGASLATGVIQYMCGLSTLCTPEPTTADTVAWVTAEDLGSQGMFSVRSSGTADIVAHGKVPFDSGNEALWGVQVDDAWPTVTGASTILIYGHPGSLPPGGDASIGDLAYRLHTFPRVPRFQDGKLHVGVCYDADVALPTTVDANVLQRNGTLLQAYSPTFAGCRSFPGTSSMASGNVLEGLLALARSALLPRSLFAQTLNPPATGGSPIDFSHFAPVAANPAGTLQFVTPPTDGVDGTALDTIRVAALSGGGTQIELVPIALYLSTNNGVPAGADFCADSSSSCAAPTDTTKETSTGYNTVATFTGVTIYKPGGYQLCARALSTVVDERNVPITFQDVCATIHLKNNN